MFLSFSVNFLISYADYKRRFLSRVHFKVRLWISTEYFALLKSTFIFILQIDINLIELLVFRKLNVYYVLLKLLKQKTKNNSIWKNVFYRNEWQNEWVKINSSYFQFFHFKCVAAHASELFCMAQLANNERFLYHSKFSF